MGKGWLDNYGKADNANNSQISLPENYEGLAYNIQGRNYSPAWGGQFQMGGNVYPVNYVPQAQMGTSIPGAVGFSYARTGSVPSNGKYAKKTMASAQNGAEMNYYKNGLDFKSKSMQDGDNIKNPLSEKEQENINKYINKLNSTEPLNINNTANTWGNMLGNVSQYMFGIKDNDLKESDYKPTIESHKNYNEPKEKYYSRPGMREDVYKDLTSDRVKKDYNWDGTFNDVYKGLKSNGKDRKHNANEAFPNNEAGYKGQYNNGHGSFKGEFNLGRYRIDAGEDENGRYISFVDKYDWNGFQTKNAINFYDRIYENQWNNVKLQDGGVIEDNRGQWAHPGEITKINSNNITMQGVNYPVLGISNTGDEQLMMPGEDYKFDGDSVTEYPLAQNGKELVKLDQLTNFTNYNTPQPGGWLNKYQ